MKRFGLGLAMVIMSSLPALLMFAHANGGATDDKEKVYPSAGKIYSPAGKDIKPSASRAPNPTKRARKTTGTVGPAAGGAGAGKVNLPPTPNDVVCTRCPSPVGIKPQPARKKHDGTLDGSITRPWEVDKDKDKDKPLNLQCKRCPPIPTDSNVKSTAPHKHRNR